MDWRNRQKTQAARGWSRSLLPVNCAGTSRSLVIGPLPYGGWSMILVKYTSIAFGAKMPCHPRAEEESAHYTPPRKKFWKTQSPICSLACLVDKSNGTVPLSFYGAGLEHISRAFIPPFFIAPSQLGPIHEMKKHHLLSSVPRGEPESNRSAESPFPSGIICFYGAGLRTVSGARIPPLMIAPLQLRPTHAMETFLWQL